MRGALLLLGCAGCDLVLGVRSFDPLPPATERVNGQLVERLVTYASDSTPTLGSRHFPATELTLTVTLDDDSVPAVTYDEATGGFTFVRATSTQAYRLHLDTADVGAFEYQLAEAAPVIGLRSLNRIDSVPITAPTPVHFAYGPLAGFALLSSIGNGTATNPGVSNTGTFDYDWKQAAPFTGTVGLLDASKHDRLYYTQLVATGSGAIAYNSISQYASLGVTMTDGVGVSPGGTLTTATPSDCAHVIAFRNTALVRQLDGAPRTYTGGADWSIAAVPGHDLGTEGEIVIVFANEGMPATDVDVMANFANPFPGSALLATMSAGGQFDVELPGKGPIQLTDLTRVFVPLDLGATCLGNLASLKSDLALPRTVSLDGLALDHDDAPLALANADHVIEWTSTAGSSDFMGVTLNELTAPGNVTVLTNRYAAITTLGKAILPAALLVSGHTYNIIVDNHTGFDAASGNLDAIRYPAGFSRLTSFTFRVM